MTAVRFRDAVAYGARLYGFLLVVTLVGGTMLALGGALVWTEYQAWAGGSGADVTAGASGGVLALLGMSILVTCYVGAAYKLLSDATTSNRVAAVDPSASTRSTAASAADSDDPEQSGPPDRQQPTAAGDEPDAPGPASEAPDVSGESAAEGTATAGTDEPGESTTDRSDPAGPPEPSPEEIAFGTSNDGDQSATEDATQEAPETVDTDETGGGSSANSVTPAGRGATSDPLADPTDE